MWLDIDLGQSSWEKTATALSNAISEFPNTSNALWNEWRWHEFCKKVPIACDMGNIQIMVNWL